MFNLNDSTCIINIISQIIRFLKSEFMLLKIGNFTNLPRIFLLWSGHLSLIFRSDTCTRIFFLKYTRLCPSRSKVNEGGERSHTMVKSSIQIILLQEKAQYTCMSRCDKLQIEKTFLGLKNKIT